MDKKYGIMGLILVVILATVMISGCTEPITSLTLDEGSVTIGENQTSYTVKGTSEAKNVTMSSDELKLDNVTVNVTNGKFEYELQIPKNIKSATVRVTAPEVENKSSSYVDLEITREEPKKEPNNNNNLVTITTVEVIALQPSELAYDDGFFAVIESTDGEVYYMYQADAMALKGNFKDHFKAKVSKGTVALNTNANIIDDVYDMNGKKLSA